MRSPLVLAALLALGCAHAPPQQGGYVARKAMAAELVRRGDWSQAFPLVQSLHAEDPADADVVALRGIVYREQGLLKEAQADLEEAVRKLPRSAAAHAALGLLYDRVGRTGESIAEHRKAVELVPGNAGYLNNLGFSLFAHGRARDAVPVLQEALRADPTQPRIRNNLGFALARTGDFAGAAEQFQMGGTPAEAKNNLGFAYERQGNLAQAYQLYREAVRADPALERARANLDHAARKLGKPAVAEPDSRS
ncbi:tetratricopeptide repeat protein [Anaeromyxobacter paludicola]|uniref:Tetratricopeptide repeat protein n=1 Tax=Anaeromyxobacter paludicola TaxID=2918171 RepID=A0ABN6N5M3_9BACT|nr:tetratricopeptide repeat protein [Anaeromyxobacter paludicola]BDG08487.1 hypothetical protein AMPC_16000 [Anaeromyxobacter paludicola]